jgi:huntingtin
VSPLGIRKRHIFKPTAESYLQPLVACENITSDKEHDECSILNNPTQNSAEYDECVEDIEGMCTLTENPSLSCLDKCHIQILPECDSTANKNNDTLDSETLASSKSSEENDERTEIPDITKRAAPIKENVTDVLNVSYERDLTNLGNFCDHDVPLIYCVRHLTATFLLSKNKGELLSDKFIRVSLKALAIGCVTNALALSPKVFLLTLRMYNDNSNNMDNPEVSRKEESTNGNGFIEDNVPLIRDVANYTRHEDPQLRGAAIQLLGQVIRGALTESGMLPLEMWYNGRRPDHVDTINIITDVLRNDKSSITVRQTYNSLKIFVKPLLESSSGDMIIPLLKHIIGIPTLSEKYWLVKTEICRLMGQLPFLTVHHLTKNTLLQQDVVDNVLMCLLGDEDQRVRTSAASCFVDIVTNLYNQAENSSLDTTTTAAVEMANTLLHPIISTEGNVQQSSVFPNKDIPLHGRLENSEKQKYVKDGAKNKGKSLATNIFRTVDRLHCALLSSTSPHLTSGCFEALLNLSISYPPTQIPSAWGCQVPKAIRKLSPALNTSGTDESSMQTSLYNRTDIKTFSTPAFEILELCSRLLSGSTTIALDHFTHSTVMQFTARLFSGLSNELLKSTLPTSSETTEASIISAAISHEERLTIISNTLMTHCFKLLAIICHVIEDAPATPLPSSISAHKSSNSNVHGNIAPLSPIGIPPLKKGNLQSASISINSSGGSNILNMSPGVKSFQSLKFDQHVSTTATTRWHVDNSSGIDGGHSDIKVNKVGQIPKQDGPTATHDSPKKMGNFISNHHYFKIYEAIKNLNNIYKRTLIKSSYGITSKYEKQDILGAFGNDCNKMHLLAVECLKCLSSLLEFSMSSQAIIEKHTEELLHYLKTLLTLDPLGVLACVQSLLRCIFRTNAAYAPLDDQPLSLSTFSGESLSGAGFFYLCFDQPYNDLVHTFHLARDSTSTPDRSESALFLTGSSKQLQFSTSSKSSGLHSSSIFKPLPGDKKSTERVKLGSYIRLFEPMVIKALKHYTLTSDVEQQCQVLQLLIQLVKLRVNYCLLDSDQIFIGFVLKQLELIEEGQIANANILIPNIFKFLVLLSYEKYHSKPIIDVPKILQLCEGLFASGQPGDIYVVPAILPVAEDLFCQRTNSTMHSKVQKQLDPNSTEEPQQNVTNTSLSELDTQREVMLTMLLKVLMYPDVIKLVIKLLQSSTTDRVRTGGSERWRKLSRTVVEAMIPLLASQKIHLDDKHTLDLLHKFFASLAPGTLRPVDILLSAVLNSSVDLTSLVDVQRWLGFIVVALPILTNQSPEEGILGRLEGLGIRVVVRDQDGVQSTSPSAQHILDTSLDSSTSVSSDGGGSLLEMGTNRPEMTMAKFILQVIGASCIKFHQLVFSQWTQASTSFLQQELSHLLLFVIYMFQSGRYYRITRAAQELAASLIPTPSHPNGDVREYDREEGEMLYSLDFVTKLFIELSHVTPFLTLQWFYILKLMKYFHHPLWQGK